jgi:hypothetical protein
MVYGKYRRREQRQPETELAAQPFCRELNPEPERAMCERLRLTVPPPATIIGHDGYPSQPNNVWREPAKNKKRSLERFRRA